MNTASQTRLLDKTLSIRTRMATLRKCPQYIEEGVSILLKAYRSGTDNDAGAIACHVASYSTLSTRTMLSIASVCKNKWRWRVMHILASAIRKAIWIRDPLVDFVEEYFKHDIPLGILKASLAAQITSDYNRKFHRDGTVLYTLFHGKRNRRRILADKVKGEELLVYISKHLLNLYSIGGFPIDVECDEVSWFYYLNTEDRQTLRDYVPYIRAMDRRGRHINAGGIARDLSWHPIRFECVDLYTDLFDIYYSARPDTGTRSIDFVNDPQNMNQIKIEADVLVELETLAAKYRDREDSMEELYQNPRLKEALELIDSNESDFHGRTLKQWLRIVFSWAKDGGRLSSLERELRDLAKMCPAAHFLRVIDVCSGFLFSLIESNTSALRLEFLTRVEARILAQPDVDEIMADFPTRAIEHANTVMLELMKRWQQWKYDDFLVARYHYLYGE